MKKIKAWKDGSAKYLSITSSLNLWELFVEYREFEKAIPEKQKHKKANTSNCIVIISTINFIGLRISQYTKFLSSNWTSLLIFIDKLPRYDWS